MQQTFEAEARSDKHLVKKYELQFCQSAANVSLKQHQGHQTWYKRVELIKIMLSVESVS